MVDAIAMIYANTQYTLQCIHCIWLKSRSNRIDEAMLAWESLAFFFFFWLSAVLLVASPQATHIPLHWQTLLKNLSCSNCTKTTWATNFNEILMCEHPWKRKIIWAQINGWKIHGIHAVLENTSLFSSTSTAHTLKKILRTTTID